MEAGLPQDIEYEWIPVAEQLPPHRLVVYGIRIRNRMQTKLGLLQLIGGHWYGKIDGYACLWAVGILVAFLVIVPMITRLIEPDYK